MKIIVYDEDEMHYLIGNITHYEITNEPIEVTTLLSNKFEYTPSFLNKITLDADCIDKETIQLDETMMKRIAKFNKTAEINKLNKIIEDKQNEINKLDDLLQDKEKRWEKVKEYISNIYDLDFNNNEDEYYYDY